MARLRAWIASGEGERLSVNEYTGVHLVSALKAKLTRERNRGDRTAYLLVGPDEDHRERTTPELAFSEENYSVWRARGFFEDHYETLSERTVVTTEGTTLGVRVDRYRRAETGDVFEKPVIRFFFIKPLFPGSKFPEWVSKKDRKGNAWWKFSDVSFDIETFAQMPESTYFGEPAGFHLRTSKTDIKIGSLDLEARRVLAAWAMEMVARVSGDVAERPAPYSMMRAVDRALGTVAERPTPYSMIPDAPLLMREAGCETKGPFRWADVSLCLNRTGVRKGKPQLTDAEAVARFLAKSVPDLAKEAREHAFVIPVDTQLRALGLAHLATGTLNAAILHPREVAQLLSAVPSYGFFLAHNHPSGDPELSPEDRNVAARMTSMGEILGIRFLDFLSMAPQPDGSWEWRATQTAGGGRVTSEQATREQAREPGALYRPPNGTATRGGAWGHTPPVPRSQAACSVCGKVGPKAKLRKHEAACKSGKCPHGGDSRFGNPSRLERELDRRIAAERAKRGRS